MWFGSPAIWTPPPISNTDIQFFDVSGSTQAELIASLKKAAICDTHKCLPDPAVPAGGTAWALEGMESPGSWSTPYCYSPRTMTVAFRTFILLPRWSPVPVGGVTIALVEKWNALDNVLYTHEAGHVAITVEDLAALNDQAHLSASCAALFAFWADPSIYDQLDADQNAYHARLRADCRPAVGCIPPGWLGW
jgi:predicted secreted Zn-dependent protease